MQSVEFLKTCQVQETVRTLQMRGLFDLPQTKISERRWSVHLDIPAQWNIGAIIGPSGSGKSSLADEIYKSKVIRGFKWSADKSICDDFPEGISIKEITALLSSVGFSTPPSWLRPFHALSTGEQFRCTVARALCSKENPIVIDEFTSVVDRTVAKIGSAAVAKSVRRFNKQFVAVSCHHDILEWLEPDWIYEPALDKFTAGRNLRRPKIELEIVKCKTAVWEIFRQHHYLNTEIHKGAQCFVALFEGQPVAFASVLHFPHPRHPNTKREHRTVCLPDFQGVGIGNAVSDIVAAMCRGIGSRYLSITSHPSMMQSRAKSKNWKCIAAPTWKTKTLPTSKQVKGSPLASRGISGGISGRLRATFEFVGEPMDKKQAKSIFRSA